jgi:ABC-type uncharacterized transport system involved in gliding motility auxiliary subunit
MEDQMKNPMNKIIPYGALLGLVLILVGLGQYGISRIWKLFSWITVVLGAVFILLYAAFHFSELKRKLSLRSVQYGGNALATALILLMILAGLNFIANRHPLRLDFTAGKQFSLSDQTKSILKKLQKDVHITAFYQDNKQDAMASLLKSYRSHSTRFSYDFVDPDKKPALAKQYGITSYNTTVLECGGNTERVTTQQEQDVTNALIKVTRDAKKAVYFLQGHGEPDIDDSERGGYASAKKAVENENYSVQKISLAEKKSVPIDCAILVVNGPQKSPFPSELDSIQTYLERGGRTFLLLDPEVPGFDAFLKKWGVKPGNDVVVDNSGMGQLFGMGPAVPLVSNYESHPITERFRLMTFFPYSRSMTVLDDKPAEVTAQSILKTSEYSWGETDLGQLRKNTARNDKNRDLQGPVSLGVVATRGNTRLVVIGDSDFGNNSYFSVQGNGDLFMNVVSWLAGQEDLISIRAKKPEDRRVFLNAQAMRLTWILTFIGMPLAAAVTGIWITLRRRKA